LTRRILCRECGHGWDVHPTDWQIGIRNRRLLVELGTVPAGLGVQVQAITETPDGAIHIHKSPKELATVIKCDLCGKEMPQGERAWAVTTWNIHREDEPGSWETKYGKIL
jgi:hypothetical protein